MHRFEFRLEKVLKVRQAAEQEFKEAFKAARQATKAMEHEIDQLDNQIERLMVTPYEQISDKVLADSHVICLKDERTSKLAALSILEQEGERAFDRWQKAKQDTEAVQKLRENAMLEYRQEVKRWEQKQLDEWTSSRRNAA